nr:PREDICTED: uncharacterized protein C18orf63-like [Fopius arisanus]
MESCDYYITIPPRSSLCCTVCTVDPDEIRDSSAKSYFHWKTLKCRYIINMMPSTVIASPIHQSKGAFYVITTRDFYKTGVLQRNLMRVNLKHSVPQAVTPRAYVDCLKYTFEFYLSPKWNRVADVYMEGHNFLSNSEFNPAICSRISLISKETALKDEIRMSLTPVAAKLPPMKLENLAISSMVVGHFLQDPEGVLDVTLFATHRVIVIPSMRKAILKRIMKKIPPTCTFQNYSEIRRHWKNMYGYRLPKTDEEMLYYEVYFPIPCATIEYFIYPDICIRREMSQRAADGPEQINRRYLQDLGCSMPKLLDEPLEPINKSQANPTNFQKSLLIDTSTTPAPVDVSQNLENSARLSLSGGSLKRDASTQMSPISSIRGKDDRKLKFNNLKRIQQIHNVIPSTLSLPRSIAKSQKPKKMFLSEAEMSKYFRNFQKTHINIFSPITQETINETSSFREIPRN